MESNTSSPRLDDADAKAAFRKPSNDTTTRKYRRRSPVSGSSSSDGSPKHDRSSARIYSKGDSARESENWCRKDDERVLDRDSGRHHHGRSGDSSRHSDRQSSRSSYYYHRRDDYVRREKLTDEEERHYSKSSSYLGRESRAGTHPDQTRKENEHHKSRDYLHGDDKFPRDRNDGSDHRSRDKDRAISSSEYQKGKDKDPFSDRAGSENRHKGKGDNRDERRDYQRGDYRNDRSPVYEDCGGHRNESGSGRDRAGHRLKEISKSDPKELDGQKYTKEEKRKVSDRESSRQKTQYDRQAGELFKERSVLNSENQDSPAKRPKVNSLDTNYEKDDFIVADERKSSKQVQEPSGKVNSDQAPASGCTAADIDAAKIAAMKAAELVNKNLIGTGYMSTDQKKKLLWGNKKSTTVEESGHRWETATFSDREQQEKFNKLMGVKGEVKVEHKPNNQESSGLQSEKQKEVQLDLEKQYIAGLRRRDGRTVGLGL